MEEVDVKKCSKCGEVKSRNEFSRNTARKDGLRSECKSCAREYYNSNTETIRDKSKNYYKANAETIRDKSKNYYKTNAEAIIERINKYQKEKRKTDPLFKFIRQVKKLVSMSLKRAGAKKNSRTEQLLGCTIAEFRVHLERQFVDGMSWENRHEWHIDHIMPMASAVTQEDAERLQHYTNLRPEWGNINLRDGAKGYKGTRAKAKKGDKA